jgi:hypothetical protein
MQVQLIDQATALATLRTISGQSAAAGIVPTRVGTTSDMRTPEAWTEVTGRYLHAFEHRVQVYPYF